MRAAVAGVTAQRNPWWIVLGAVLGLTVGNGPVMQFTFGAFLLPVAAALQVERGTISAALMAGLIMTGIATPLFGLAVDRFGVRAVALRAIALFATGMAAIGFGSRGPASFICLYALAGIAAAGQSPMTYCTVIAGVFDRRRGLALGVAMAGVGIGAALMPHLARLMIARWDWRIAYLGLALLTLALALPAMAWLVTRPRQAGSAPAAPAAPGLTARQALRAGVFWRLAVVFFIVAMTASGVTAHLAPLMVDRGAAGATAAMALSIAGVSLIGGRLLAGFLLDRLFAPYVAAAFFALPLAGVVLLLFSNGPAAALAAAVLVGLGLGAEVDLIAFLQSRYLGLRAFGQIYGYLFAIFMLGSGLGPFAMGMSHQLLGSYAPALAALGVLLGAACLWLTRLGPYVFRAGAVTATPGEEMAAAHL